MTHRARLILLAAALAAISGCTHTRHPLAPATQPVAQRPALPPEALLRLDQIQPAPVLAKGPSTRATTRPAPLEALDLYAQARGAMLDNRRFTAIALLEKAIQLDPYSFELEYSLGRSYLQPGSPPDKAIEAFEKAAELDPQNIDVRLQLARLYIGEAQAAKAIHHLRLAQQSEAYRKGEDTAAMTDLLLARALQQKGYYRASLDEYTLLADRLAHAGPSIRSNPELLYLINRPEILLAQTAQVEEELGDYPAALKGYDAALKRDPGNFDLYSRTVHVLTAERRYDDAAARAAQAVRLFHASGESLDLLRDVYKRMGRESAMADELAKLHAERPADRAVLFALADVLDSQGRTSEAEQLLSRELEVQHYSMELVKRLFRYYQRNAQTEEGARLLIEAMAANPDSLREMGPMWDDILRFSQKNRLRLSTLQKLQVPPFAESAKLYWVARVAQMWNREQLSRTSLEQAVRLSPPLAPAYRMRVDQIWASPDLTEAAKREASGQLVQSADGQGQPALAAELKGLSLAHEKKPAEAAAAFEQAMKLGRPSIDLQLNYAAALIQQGQNTKGEEVLWRLVNDNPTFDDGYQLLFQYYVNHNDGQQALKVLSTWATADPTSVDARLLQASVFLQARRPDAAEALLQPLFDQYPDNPSVLAECQALYAQSGRMDQYVKKLEDERVRHPQNRVAAEQLVRIYDAQKRTAEASRVLDSLRAGASNDVDFLYFLSHLYNLIGQKQTGEEVLQQCLQVDPGYSPACNDLGYSWADQGKNLPRAEALIKAAVAAEPDNQSYLDSLGWVLYKRGEFADAAHYLQQAVDAAVDPDPVVLNHLGDALYRLGKKQDAVKQWKRSDQSMGSQPQEREDLQGLKLELQEKLKQADKGQAVNVAPVASAGAAPAQAKQ